MTSWFSGLTVPGLGSTPAIDINGNASFASLAISGATTLATASSTTLTSRYRLILGTLTSPAPTAISVSSGDGVALQMISGTSFQISNTSAVTNVGFISVPSGLSLIGAAGSSSTNLAGIFIGGDPAAVAPYTASNVWGLYSAGKVKVENATAAGAGTGAFVVTGGAYFGAAAVMNNGLTSLTQVTISASTNQLLLGNTTLSSTTGTARTLTFPDATDTLAAIAATQTLTNKTLSGVVISGSANATASLAPLYSSPTATNISGLSSNVYFNYFAAPTTSGGNTATGATVYVAGAPTGVNTPYALWVAAGNTLISGGLIKGTQTFSASGSASSSGGYLILGTATGNITVTLFTAVTGQELYIAHVGTGGTMTIAVANTLTDQFNSSGQTSIGLAVGERLHLVAYVSGSAVNWLMY